AVEAVARSVDSRRPVEFALPCGLAIGTVGLAAEWGWLTFWGHDPWPAAMMPDAFAVGILAALGAAVVGAAIGTVLAGERPLLSARVVPAALLAIAVALAIPFPRQAGDVRATVLLR